MRHTALRTNAVGPPAGKAGGTRTRQPTVGPRGVTGFTLVELLVVIAIIGILVSLLMPTVGAVRESARRLQCRSRLKQIAEAVSSYNTVHSVLPPAGIVDEEEMYDHRRVDDFESRTGNQFSWLVMILPQLEQENLYNLFDSSLTVFEQINEPQAVHVPILLCPTDGANGRFFSDSTLTQGKRFAKGNYAAYTSPFHTELSHFFPGAIPGYAQPMALIQGRDGTSNTIMISEVLAREHEQDQRGAWALPWTGSSLLAFDMHHKGPIYISKPPGDSRYWYHQPRPTFLGWSASLGQTQPPNNQGPNMDMLYQCPEPEEAIMSRMPCNVWSRTGSHYFLSAAPRSNHKGGVNVAFADGHIGFLPDSVDEFAMAYLISIDDGQRMNIEDHVQ